MRLVLRDEPPFDSLWTTMSASFFPRQHTAPVVDLGKEMLLVAGDGLQSGGYTIAIMRVSVRNDTIVAVVHVGHDGPHQRADGMWSPVAIARMAHDARPVIFVNDSTR
jgi:hypothetical protein